MPKALSAAVLALTVLAAQLAAPARAQDDVEPQDGYEQDVLHAPLEPEVRSKVRAFVHDLAESFGGFYPGAEFRNVHAVWFPTGAIIVCGELNKMDDSGSHVGWRYFSNSGPLIFEGDGPETLCDRRTYFHAAFTDDHEYGLDFTQEAERALVSGQGGATKARAS